MTSRLHFCVENGIQCPDFVKSNLQYETIAGSVAYGISTDYSDQDMLGWCIPLKSHLFPSLCGEIEGFHTKLPRFEQYVKHEIKIKENKYDLTVFSITKLFNLAAQGNINVLESLFTPIDCVTYQTPIGTMVRNHRHLFLSKKIKHSVIGYAYSQRANVDIKKNTEGNRKELREKYGWDTKFLAHTIRLLQYGEQILETQDLDLRAGNEIIRACRKGEVTPAQVDELFAIKEKKMEQLYTTSPLPYSPDWDKIKQLLLDCIEHHYGSLENYDRESKYEDAIRKIAALANSVV